MDYNKAAMELHQKYNGKTETGVPFLVDSQEVLSTVYTPGVAEPCRVIAKDPSRAFDLTSKGRTVAIVSDGTAVLGLGNIGPEAGLPVMEGKAVLFKQLAGVDAVPLCVNTSSADELVETVKRLAPTFGGINLEDIAAPMCFEVERRLKEELDIPVFHDDQHGTAIVILAGLINAARVTDKDLGTLKVLIHGAGAAGLATAHLLERAGVEAITVMDSRGVLTEERDDLNDYKQEVLAYNRHHVSGDLTKAIEGQDVFIGVSVANVLTKEMVETMANGAIVFAMANPDPEILPQEAYDGGAAVVATGRSDYANQINNALVFPGLFKGLLAARSTHTSLDIYVAAAQALAAQVATPTADHIIPGVLDDGIADVLAKAVQNAL